MIFTEFKVIRTDNLLLRKIIIDDAKDMFEIFSDKEVLKYYDLLPHKAISETVEFIKLLNEWYENRKGIRWGIIKKDENKLVGTCGFHHFDEEFKRAEIGYELNKNYWKNGIMKEALKEIIEVGFDFMNLNRIEGIVDNENEASKIILIKLGFKFEGCLRKRFYFNEEFRDEHYYGLLKSEWTK